MKGGESGRMAAGMGRMKQVPVKLDMGFQGPQPISPFYRCGNWGPGRPKWMAPKWHGCLHQQRKPTSFFPWFVVISTTLCQGGCLLSHFCATEFSRAASHLQIKVLSPPYKTSVCSFLRIRKLKKILKTTNVISKNPIAPEPSLLKLSCFLIFAPSSYSLCMWLEVDF